MHIIGKIFLGLTALLAIFAVLTTAKLINTRNHWMREISQNQDELEQSTKTLADNEKKLGELEAQLTRQRLSWDTMFAAPNSGVVDEQGMLRVGIGPQQGFGVVPQGSPPAIVHAFVPQAGAASANQAGAAGAEQGGAMLYVGPYQVVAAQGRQTDLKPMFRVFPADVKNWPRGTWTLWQVIPSQAPTRVVQLTNKLVKANEALVARQATLDEQTAAVAAAKADLAIRQRELMGNPDAEELAGSPEVTQGLVAALQAADAARNAELAKVDSLRRKVDEAYRKLQRVVAQNKEIARKLTSQSSAIGDRGLDLSDAR